MDKHLTGSHDASSAGTRVEGVGETLEEFGKQPGITSFTKHAKDEIEQKSTGTDKVR